MHEAERYLQITDIMLWLKYADILRRITKSFGGACATISSTAAERAEAFVLTMEKI
jgi:hypothetical protein